MHEMGRACIVQFHSIGYQIHNAQFRQGTLRIVASLGDAVEFLEMIWFKKESIQFCMKTKQ